MKEVINLKENVRIANLFLAKMSWSAMTVLKISDCIKSNTLLGESLNAVAAAVSYYMARRYDEELKDEFK